MDGGRDLPEIADPIDNDEPPGFPVVFQHRPDRAPEGPQPDPNHFVDIVRTRREGVAALVADLVPGRRVEPQVIGRPAVVANDPPPKPPVDLGGRDVQVDDGIQAAAEFGEQVVQEIRLGERARVAVEQHFPPGFQRPGPFGDHRIDHLVGDQDALLDVFFGKEPHRPAPRDVFPQQIAGDEMGESVPLEQVFCVRSFAPTGWADQCEVHKGLLPVLCRSFVLPNNPVSRYRFPARTPLHFPRPDGHEGGAI
jgi:hypothetical protein